MKRTFTKLAIASTIGALVVTSAHAEIATAAAIAVGVAGILVGNGAAQAQMGYMPQPNQQVQSKYVRQYQPAQQPMPMVSSYSYTFTDQTNLTPIAYHNHQEVYTPTSSYKSTTTITKPIVVDARTRQVLSSPIVENRVIYTTPDTQYIQINPTVVYY